TTRYFTPESLREALPNFKPGEAEMKAFGARRVWESGVIVLNNKEVPPNTMPPRMRRNATILTLRTFLCYTGSGPADTAPVFLGTNGSSNDLNRGLKRSCSLSCSNSFRGLAAVLSV